MFVEILQNLQENTFTEHLWTTASRMTYVLLIYTVIREGVHLTLPPDIFSVQVKSGSCYIMDQWGQLQNKIET